MMYIMVCIMVYIMMYIMAYRVWGPHLDHKTDLGCAIGQLLCGLGHQAPWPHVAVVILHACVTHWVCCELGV